MDNTINCPKCDHEHEASGSHEDDEGQMTCDNCGFEFVVEIEYEPSYNTYCVVHEYGAEELVQHHPSGTWYMYRECVHCCIAK